MRTLESRLREEFGEDGFAGPNADDVLATVAAVRRGRQRRAAVAGAVAVLVIAAGALLLPGLARPATTPAKPRGAAPAIAGIDSANAADVISNLERAGMNPNGPLMINAKDGYGRFTGCPIGKNEPACVPYWAVTTDGGRTFRAVTPQDLDLNYMYMFDADHLVLDKSGPDWPTVPAYGEREVSSDGGRTWRSVGVNVAGTVGFIPAGGQLISVAATSKQSAVGVLYPDGSTRRLTTVPPGAHIVPRLSWAAGVSVLYLPVTDRVLISVDAGRTWLTRTVPWTNSSQLWVLGEQSGQLLITDEMSGPNPGDMYATGDDGLTWQHIAWPVDAHPLAPTTVTRIDGTKRSYVWASYSAVSVEGIGLCVSDGAALWCRDGSNFVRVPGARPIIDEGGGLLFTLGGTIAHPVLYSSADARHWTRVTMVR